MRRIRIPNIRLISSERTFLDADYTSGTSLTVVSNLGFAAQDIAVIGEVGEEKTESKDVMGVTSNTGITVSATYKFPHNKSVVIYRSEYDQINIERKLSTSTTWASITTMYIQWDKPETLFVDQSGGDTHDYRFRFYNSISASYSEYSPTVAGSGFSRRQIGALLMNIRRKIRDLNKQRFTDTELIQKIQDGQTDIDSMMLELWFLKVDTFEASNGISTVAGEGHYSLANYTDLNFVAKIRYKYVTGTTQLWDLMPLSDEEFAKYMWNQSSPPVTDVVRKFKILPPDSSSDQGYFRVYPLPQTTGSTFYPVYYRKLTPIVTIADETDLLFPEILEDYVAWKCHQIMGNKTDEDKYRLLYYGPAGRGITNEQLTGIALLKVQNRQRDNVTGYGRSLWRFRGRQGNPYRRGSTVEMNDYIRENFIN